MKIGDTVYAARNIWLHEVFTPPLGDNYVVVEKDEVGEVIETQDDGRVWVLFEDNEWCCEQNMLLTVPRIRKLYREALITDVVDVFFLDDHGDSMGEITFKRYDNGLRAEIDLPSFGIMRLAQDIFDALSQSHSIAFADFVKLLRSIGYEEDDETDASDHVPA